MDRNFQWALSRVLQDEGGFVNDPHDPGGATNKGITIATFRRYVSRNATIDDLKHLTTAQAATVYRKRYWNAVKGDDLPDGVDYAVFDFAVNSGPARAVKYLQAIAGVPADGKIGPQTLTAVKAMDSAKIINMLCDRRLDFLRGLPTWPRYKNGWTDRVHGVREASLGMVPSTNLQKPPVDAAKTAGMPVPHVPHETAERPSAPVSGRKVAAAGALAAIAVGLAAFWHHVIAWIERIF